jgi:uncharacterized repeat protein (TIGR01451 family)
MANKMKLVVLGLVAAAASFVGYAYLAGDVTHALTPSARDCDNNSIVYCGVISPDELVTKYAANKTGDLRALYGDYGISAAMINGRSQKQGYVTRSGDVYYNGKIVARKAISVGREYRAGSWTLRLDGRTYYEHYTGAHYATGVDAIASHIWFDSNGKFVAAIMYSCGNPVRATPEPVPVAVCESLVVDRISRTTFRLTGKAVATGGASITAIHYYAYDAAGKIIASVPGAKGRAVSTVQMTIAVPGTYRLQAIALTTLGHKTSSGCARTVTVTPEPCDVPGKEHLPMSSPLCFKDKPSIRIEKTVNDAKSTAIKVGERFTYKIVVTNTGNVALKNVVVTDRAPSQVALLHASKGTIRGSQWSTTVPELKVAASTSYTLTARYNVYTAGAHKNTVCVDTPTIAGKPDDCDEATTRTTQDMTVCDTTTNRIVIIDRSKYDTSRMTTDTTKCGNMHVCELSTKDTLTIQKNKYDESKYTIDLAVCTDPKADPPAELPHTGIAGVLGAGIGVSSLIGATTYYVASRRAIR